MRGLLALGFVGAILLAAVSSDASPKNTTDPGIESRFQRLEQKIAALITLMEAKEQPAHQEVIITPMTEKEADSMPLESVPIMNISQTSQPAAVVEPKSDVPGMQPAKETQRSWPSPVQAPATFNSYAPMNNYAGGNCAGGVCYPPQQQYSPPSQGYNNYRRGIKPIRRLLGRC